VATPNPKIDPSPALGNPHRTRVPTFPQRPRRVDSYQARRRTPPKSWAPSDSCTEPNFVDELQKAKNRVKARVRAKVEHPFRILKRIFGFEKVRYRGLKKNHQRLCACFALVNLYLHRKRLAVA